MNEVAEQEEVVLQADDDFETARLEKAFKSGTSWFYWIGALSAINAILTLLNTSRSFLIGLGVTYIIIGFGEGMGDSMPSAAGIFNLIATVLIFAVSGLFVLFGVLSSKGKQWAHIIGMVLYAADALIFLLVSDWLSIAFHAFALFNLFRGLQAYRELRALQKASPSPSPAVS